jgi:DNA polymerase I-like protein with 3'-5' exonuclease and polymerase domains
MKLVELLQKYLGETTSPDQERKKLNKLCSPHYASLLIPKDVVYDPPKEDSSTTLKSQEILDNEGITVHYLTDPDQAVEAIAALVKIDITLGLDIETARLSPYKQYEEAGRDPHLSRIRLVQICIGKTVYIFDAETVSLNLMGPLWDCPMVAHSAVFEIKHLIHAGVNPQNIECTMLMENALNGGLFKLTALSKKYLGRGIPKEQQTSNWNAPSLSQDQLAYAALDAADVFRLFKILKTLLKEKERFPVYFLMRDAQKAIATLELNGCYFNLNGHSKLMEKWQDVKENNVQELQKVLGPDVNLDSPAQLSQWFMNNIDDNTLSNWPRTETDQLKTGASILANFPDHPLIKPLIKYKEVGKLLSSFGTKFAEHINPKTGRIQANVLALKGAENLPEWPASLADPLKK